MVWFVISAGVIAAGRSPLRLRLYHQGIYHIPVRSAARKMPGLWNDKVMAEVQISSLLMMSFLMRQYVSCQIWKSLTSSPREYAHFAGTGMIRQILPLCPRLPRRAFLSSIPASEINVCWQVWSNPHGPPAASFRVSFSARFSGAEEEKPYQLLCEYSCW